MLHSDVQAVGPFLSCSTTKKIRAKINIPVQILTGSDRFGSVRTGFYSVLFDSVLLFMVDSVRFCSIMSDSIRFGSVRFGPLGFDSIRFGWALFGSVRSDFVGFGSVRFDSVVFHPHPFKIYGKRLLGKTAMYERRKNTCLLYTSPSPRD